jgi:predicted GNAT family acetyltransferase
MQLHHFSDVPAYKKEIQTFLAEDEVANGLLLGLLMSARPRQGMRHKPYLAYLEDNQGPLLAAAMLNPRRLLLSSHRAVPPSAMRSLAQHLHQNGRRVQSIFGPADMSGAFANAWAAKTGLSPRPGLRQRLMELEQVKFPSALPNGRLRLATEDDAERIAQWTVGFQTDSQPGSEPDIASAQTIAARLVANGDLFLWENGEPVSMASRARPTAYTIAINLVYTPPEQRGRGYASACVAHLCQWLLDNGYERCTLFTDTTNRTSNHIYQEIGYRPVMEYAEYEFTMRDR